jgi:hypothetical protein
MKHAHVSVALILLLPSPALPCSICGGDFQNRQTLRQELAGAKVVVVGTLSNARLNADGGSEGRTDFTIEHIIKGAGLLKGVKALTIPRYYPGDGSGPQRGVFFFDVREGNLGFVAGRTVRTEQFASYLRSVAALDSAESLAFYARHLDHADPDIAADAFVELARSTDADIARVARVVDAERLRRLLKDANTPPERIGLIAFLLAGAGNAKDAELMLAMLKQAPEDRPSMRRGLLVGYVVLKPREGWEMTLGLLADSKRGFLERNAAFGVLLFFHNWKPDENRVQLLRGMRSAVETGDLADMAVEELRRWRCWDLSASILAQFTKRTHESALVRRAIVRYALACPQPAAQRFVAELRKRDPELVADVSESLDAEK